MSRIIDEKTLSQIKNLNYKLTPFKPNENKPKAKHIVRDKIVDMKTAIKNCGLKDGMTISFHHHFRGGDLTVKHVMETIKDLKIKKLTIASSSFTDAHNFLTTYIEDGYVVGLETSGCRDELGRFISSGKCPKPMIIRSHGGRARAIESGDLKIDVAFIAASSSDCLGNSNGTIGKSLCGSLGYAMVDAKYATKTIIITDTIVDYPNQKKSISQSDVDWVVKVDTIGDSKKIVGGEIRLTSAPKEEIIAKNIGKIVTNTSLFQDGFSIQMGSGGASLSAIKVIKEEMIKRNIKASFCLGGITSHQVKLLDEGLVERLIDTQCFDYGAVESISNNANHMEISASEYANPSNKSPFVNKLDYVILSALEVDLDFNVNVITGSDGIIRGASGGHSDTADGAKISIIALPLIRGRISCISEKVNTIITPGNTVDIVVSDFGIAVNPIRTDLIKELKEKNIPLITLSQMKEMAESVIGVAKPIDFDYSKPVAVVEYRDGSVIDVVYKVK
ncbi:citrate lyase subunit alpha [Spiroplasma endosymbiont of Aspidapion aeneum]|uniref:citrate lyase subunit alpha n=1 Tax=Spiroplasma endosymbiont of Aspidapion aeneum TaxID=3066276 RepID=UPI00313A8C01